jgi:multisubunit Na+/H+ antiporter MnhB subunit
MSDRRCPSDGDGAGYASGRSGALNTPDAVLAAIPVLLLLGAAFSLVSPLSPGTALAAGAVPATGTIGYALFYDPPGN